MKRSNDFNREKLELIFGEFPEKFLHFIGISGEGIPDAFHHILKRNKENPTLSSLFNALPVENFTHLKYHGKLLLIENKILFLNLVAVTIYRNFKHQKENNIMFRADLFFTDTDRLFIEKYKKHYTSSTIVKLKKMELC